MWRGRCTAQKMPSLEGSQQSGRQGDRAERTFQSPARGRLCSSWEVHQIWPHGSLAHWVLRVKTVEQCIEEGK